jgi:CHASE2 domain-containing sensor protein
MDAAAIREEMRTALHEAAKAARADVATLDAAQAAVINADNDPPLLDGVQRQALDDLMRFLPHVDPDERLAMVESHVNRASRAPLTAASRGQLRYLASLMRSMGRDAAFDVVNPATSDRGAKLGNLLHVVQQLGRDPRAVGAERARRYAALLDWEVGQLEAAILESHDIGDRTWANYALRPESRVFSLLEL